MSEDFDKEAEREKLREKYEADRERRETTQQMSELLLKGATMTNKHCDTCGDPIFRHDGQEFCANCRTAGPAGGAGEQRAANGGADDPETAGGQPSPPTADAPAPGTGDDPAVRDDQPSSDQPTADPSGGTSEVPVEPEPSPDRSPGPSPESPRRGADRGETPAPRRERSDATRTAPPSDDAPAHLQRSLEKFSRLAAETDDPREAKQHLAAAREAAEALSALRR